MIGPGNSGESKKENKMDNADKNNKFRKIEELDIDKIEEKHLINIEVGRIFFRRTDDPNPLRIHWPVSEGTMFTTKIEEKESYVVKVDSGSNYMTETPEDAMKEGRRGGVYLISVKKKIERILDLDIICNEQNINASINPDKRVNRLYDLYGIKLKERRVYGIRYQSKRIGAGHCFCFFDNIDTLDEYMDYTIHKPE